MAFALLDHTEEKTTIDEILTGTFREKDRQINFAIEELEKIKAKIEKLNNTDYGSMFSYESHQGAGDMQDDIIGIIEKHISELKGE